MHRGIHVMKPPAKFHKKKTPKQGREKETNRKGPKCRQANKQPKRGVPHQGNGTTKYWNFHLVPYQARTMGGNISSYRYQPGKRYQYHTNILLIPVLILGIYQRFRLGYKVKFSGLATKGSKRKLPLEFNQKNWLLFKIESKLELGCCH
jgi:hypothetical protein